MKPVFFLSLIAGLTVSVAEGSERAKRQARWSRSSYESGTAHPSLKLDKVDLKQLPETLIQVDSKTTPAAALSSRQSPAGNFYECRNSNPVPADSDCNTIIDEVLALDQPLIVATNACLTFQYGTCWGFFCSLCQQLSTDTTFVANELVNAESLCVANGQIGTIVGADAPQWQAGFVYQGSSLPDYDVC
ncbi:uncharacterized protein F4822DRAFT_95579 [Hypoxylon trugodes]|uniref:uncharacterized protein n=1 Tax=Hypoxylon trugodes TaxID=326681 RepID=UPI00219274A4|nr:uncharacterized protein F4822DRAFT_95579 [Hypoxylon trugodes]KAI1382745.1 hypothetical protein F4822DRAFT_95579 [Hypoxylon trugodes]